jgi:hypothetical protein
MVVMAAKEKVGAEVKVLLPAVARNIRRAGDAEASAQFIIFLPGLYVQVPGFIARADNHKIAGFTRSG